MSTKSTTVVARPYFNLAAEEAIANDKDTGNDQNPENNNVNSDTAGQTTSQQGTTATSDSEDQNYRERWVNLKRHHDTKIHEARKRIQQLEQDLNNSTIVPPKTEEELAAFASKNPEFYSMMQTVAMKNGAGIDPQRVERLEQELEESRQKAAMSMIKAKHPDYVDIVTNTQFKTWLGSQSQVVKDMVEKNAHDAAAFIRALDLYKLDAGVSTTNTGTSFEKSNHNNSAADAVITQGSSAEVGMNNTDGRIWTREEISKLSPAEYSKYEADIDKAAAEGRVR